MPGDWTRRQILLGGALLLGSACTARRGPDARQRDILYADEVVRGRAGAGVRYVVRPGDTLSSIARRSGLGVGEIAAANRLDSHLISPGQVLLLPGAVVLGPDPLADELARRERLAAMELGEPPAADWQLVPRSRWTKQAVGSNHRPMRAVTRITIHHTGEHPGMAGLADIEIVKRIERYHREGRDWSAIGYHYLVGGDGRIYEGRPATIQGAHVSGENEHNIGISCIGDFHRVRPGARQLGALQSFLDAQRRRYGVALAKVFGHRDLGKTICPGNALYEWLRSYKRA